MFSHSPLHQFEVLATYRDVIVVLMELHEENQFFFCFFSCKSELADFEEATKSMRCIGHGLTCVASLASFKNIHNDNIKQTRRLGLFVICYSLKAYQNLR